jgi:hypothetical protein
VADDFALALQKALVSSLKQNAAINALVEGRVYDEPPRSPTYPYIRLAELTPAAFDTDSTEGALVQIGFAVESRPEQGRTEAVRIAEAIKSALHRNEDAVSVEGFTLIELIFQTYSASRDPRQGRGYIARIALQAMLEETA